MKALFFTILGIVVLSSFSLKAQKNVDLDNVWCNVAYRNSPTEPQDPLFFYYSSDVISTKTTEQRVNLDEIKSALTIAGQKKAEVPQPEDMLLQVNLGDLIVVSSDISERVEEKKDKDGKVTDRYYYYKVNVVYTFTGGYKILKGGKVLNQAQLYSNSRQYYTSNEYGTRKAAADFWNNNRDVLITGFTRDLSLTIANNCSKTASALYGFPVTGTRDIIKTIDEKKHPENNDFRAAASTLKEQLESMTPEKPMDKETIDKLIEYFKSLPAKYTDLKVKADVRIRYAAYYNLCKIYIYMDEPDKVAEYANLILENGHDKKDCERMNKMAEEVKTVLNRTEIKTRHFDPELHFSDN